MMSNRDHRPRTRVYAPGIGAGIGQSEGSSVKACGGKAAHGRRVIPHARCRPLADISEPLAHAAGRLLRHDESTTWTTDLANSANTVRSMPIVPVGEALGRHINRRA
jgi:hypothetical protein